MDTPIQNNIESRPETGTESLRIARVAKLRREIEALDAQKSAKEQELIKLQLEPSSLFEGSDRADRSSPALRPEEKIALFLELFGARRDVYPKFWENRSSGKKGYSPAYINDHVAGGSGKRLLPLDDHVIEKHLRGQQAIGVYPLRPDDSCIFLAADFDGEGWRENVLAYREVAQKSGVNAATERSRSGNGAHAWIFFAEPVPAALARRLGTILIAKASALRPTMSLNAYDRLSSSSCNPSALSFHPSAPGKSLNGSTATEPAM